MQGGEPHGSSTAHHNAWQRLLVGRGRAQNLRHAQKGDANLLTG
jgi:hypothetical protein